MRCRIVKKRFGRVQLFQRSHRGALKVTFAASGFFSAVPLVNRLRGLEF